MSCNQTLSAIELVPILSYVYLRGRCRSCRTKISPQYPLVEILAGVLTVVAYAGAPTLYSFIATLAFLHMLLFIAIYDLRHTIIPDAFVYALSMLALMKIWLSAGMPTDFSMMGNMLDPYALIAGPVFALPLWALWYFSRGRAMGLGDAKLFLAIGWFLGLSAGAAAFILSFWIGAVIGVLLMLASRNSRREFTMKSEIPFGPFIASATVIVYATHTDIYSILSLFG